MRKFLALLYLILVPSFIYADKYIVCEEIDPIREPELLTIVIDKKKILIGEDGEFKDFTNDVLINNKNQIKIERNIETDCSSINSYIRAVECKAPEGIINKFFNKIDTDHSRSKIEELAFLNFQNKHKISLVIDRISGFAKYQRWNIYIHYPRSSSNEISLDGFRIDEFLCENKKEPKF